MTVGLLSIAMLACLAPGPSHDIPVPTSSAFSTSWNRRVFSHSLWSGVLSDHVDDSGLVDYGAVQSDARFQEYLFRLANTNPRELSDGNHRLAFWINAYNALAIQGVLFRFPKSRTSWSERSVLDVTVPGLQERGKGFFQGLRFNVGGRWYTLDEIEKAVLLRKPDWIQRDERLYREVGAGAPDSRVHFALVCAARGCVKLRREAYEGSRVNAQLDDAVRRFAADPSRASFDLSSRSMRVSQLLDWYRADMTSPRLSPHAKSVAAFLSRYVENGELARSLAEDEWKVGYIEYDWKLNVKPE